MALPLYPNPRIAGLARVCKLLVEAEATGAISVPTAAVRIALDGVDIDGYAQPRKPDACAAVRIESPHARPAL